MGSPSRPVPSLFLLLLVAFGAPSARAACNDGIVNGGEACDPSAPGGDAACVGACIPAGQPGQCTCAVPSEDVRDYVAVAHDTARVGTDALVLGGGVAVTASGGRLLIGRDAQFSGGTAVVGNKTSVRSGASLGRLFANEAALRPGVALAGGGPFTVALPLTIAVPAPPVVVPGNTDVDVGEGQTVALPPGSYGNVTVQARGTLRLNGLSPGSGAGRYQFAAVTILEDGRLIVDNPVVIGVAGRFGISRGAIVGPSAGLDLSGGDIQLNVAGSGVKLSPDSHVSAYIRAPGGRVRVGRGATLSGRIVAKKVTTARGMTLSAAGTCGDGRLHVSERCDASAPLGDVACPGRCIPGDPAGQGRIEFGQPGQCTCACDVDADCDDGNVCNGIDRCVAGICKRNLPPDCDDDNPCTRDCDPVQGCVNRPVEDGRTCSDQDQCTVDDTCQGGVCVAGPARECGDGNPCTDDTCEPTTGCVRTVKEDGASCTDGNACTTQEQCVGGLCVSGSTRSCVDGNPCTDDTCDPVLGCARTPLPNGTECSDGNPCTVADTCLTGQCVPGTTSACDDDNPCTADSCDPVLGCTHTPLGNGSGCSDGSACTVGDQCLGGVCVPGAPLVCADGQTCTTDACDPAIGCVNTALPNGTACSDGNACTAGDTCLNGSCGGGTPANCDDGNPCTADVCDGTTGCGHLLLGNGTPCPGGTCQNGSCRQP